MLAKDELFKRVRDIFRDVFDDPELEINSDTSSADIEDWDSLNHIYLVVAMEKEFGIRFALGELEGLKNVGALLELLGHKMGLGG